jgi:hypothetical protein
VRARAAELRFPSSDFHFKLEPIAAVGDPPTGYADGDGGDECPPKWQREVGEETADRKGYPKDFALHENIVRR